MVGARAAGVERVNRITPGIAVRNARVSQAMSTEELAASSTIPGEALASIESGRTRLSIVRAEKLARALRAGPFTRRAR